MSSDSEPTWLREPAFKADLVVPRAEKPIIV